VADPGCDIALVADPGCDIALVADVKQMCATIFACVRHGFILKN